MLKRVAMKSNFKKYLGESLLIVFSVLFALFINKAFDDYKTRKEKAIAKESIMNELYRNQAILASWKPRHIEIRDRVIDIVEGRGDSLKTELRKYDYFSLGVLTKNESLVDALLTSTAWESAKTTGILSEFDYETIQQLTLVYDMQEVLSERTFANILDYYFDSESHDMQNLDQILVQYQLRFWELVGQEELMTTFYEDAIKQINR